MRRKHVQPLNNLDGNLYVGKAIGASLVLFSPFADEASPEAFKDFKASKI